MPQRYKTSKKQAKKYFDRALRNTINNKNADNNWIQNTANYSAKQFLDILTYAGLDKTSIEDSTDTFREKAEGYGSTPSADTTFRSLRSLYADHNPVELDLKLSNLLQNQVAKLPEFRRSKKRNKLIWLRRGLKLAIDLHDEEYYGDPIFDEDGNELTMVGPKKDKTGKTRLVFRYATVSIIWDTDLIRPPLTVGFACNFKGQPREELIEFLLTRFQERFSWLKIDLVLLDGGFASVECLKLLDTKKIKYIVRGKFSETKDYPGDFKHSFPYDLKEGTKDEYRVEAYLIKMKTKKKKKKTCLLLGPKNHRFKAEEAKQLYKLRFRIENTYRHARVCKIRTSTRDYRIRAVLWAFSHLLELIWELTRMIHQTQEIDCYESRQKRIIRMYRSEVFQNIIKAIYPFEYPSN